MADLAPSDEMVSPADISPHSVSCPVPGMVALYRFYGAHEELLYVGVSNDPRRRWRQHAQEKPWYPLVRHQALTWYPGEREARRAEDSAITEESPQFNVAGAIRPVRSRITLHPSRWAAFAAAVAAAQMALVFVMIVSGLSPKADAFLVPADVALMVMMPVAFLAAFAVAGAPAIRRFAAWIERNSQWPSRDDAE